MDAKEIEIATLVIAATFIILLLLLLVINLMLTARNRRLKHQSELLLLESKYRENVSAIKMEVAEATLADVSRDLHDEVGQLLTFSILQIGNIAVRPENEKSGMIDEVQSTLREALETVRSISRGISPDFISKQGLVVATKQLCERASSRTGIITHLKTDDNFHIENSSAALISFRIIRECLTNTLRHAKAKNVSLKFEQNDNDISITFSDDGIGLAEPASDHLSLGLSAMKKYAALINGSIDFTNNESGGFKMHLTFNVQSAPSI